MLCDSSVKPRASVVPYRPSALIPLHQNGEHEQEIGTASQDGTGGFAYQNGAASFTPKTAVLPLAPSLGGALFLAGSVEQARQREPAGLDFAGNQT
jgi:hypothetical protein